MITKIFNLKSQQKGFTLVELLASIIVLVAVGSVIAGIISSTLRGTNKTNTIERVVPSDIGKKPALTADETKLLNQLKTVGSFVATIVVRSEGAKDNVVGSGFFFGDNRVIVAPAIPETKEGETYIVQSIFGEQEIEKISSEKDYSILELKKKEVTPPPSDETPVTPASAEEAVSETPSI